MTKNKKNKKFKNFLTFIFSVILLAFICIIGITQYLCPKKYSESVKKYAVENGLDENLVYAIIKAESNFDEKAVSLKNAKGLMQLTDQTALWSATEIGIDNFDYDMVFEPDVNIQLGCWYISLLLKQFDGNLDTAIAAYNAGSGNVSKWLNDSNYSDDGINLKNIPFGETKKYVLKVNLFYKLYQLIY